MIYNQERGCPYKSRYLVTRKLSTHEKSSIIEIIFYFYLKIQESIEKNEPCLLRLLNEINLKVEKLK